MSHCIRGALWTGIAAACVAALASAQTSVSWTARQDGAGSGNDVATNLTIDSAGNIYVTGSVNGGSAGGFDGYDYETIKFDPDGNVVWSASYDGPNSSFDQPYAIGLDGDGNVYVSGTSTGPLTAPDIATVKYDANGNELWVRRYNGPGNRDDAAFDLVLDADGNVYVAGWSDGPGTGINGWDFITIKYDPAGNVVWEQRYDGPAGGGDRANALALDAAGNLYVTGRSRGVATYDDYTTIKYDPSGQEVWVARYSGTTGIGIDNALDIAVDAAGNSHITGYSDGTGAGPDGWDCATVKYDSAGNELWAKRYDGPGSKWDEGWQIVLDDAGNVHVGGGSVSGGNNWDFATLKYDSVGNELWVRRYDGPGSGFDEAFALALDAAGNVYVTGGSEGLTGSDDFATIAYTPDGTELWVARYDGPGSDLDDAYVVQVDGAGNLVIAGESYGGQGTELDFTVAKFPLLGLYGDREQISLAAGGQQALSLGAGLDHAGRLHLVLGSLLGTEPGLVVDSVVLPLVTDAYFVHTLGNPNAPPLTGSFGSLSASGRAEAAFSVPAGSPPAWAGVTLHHAYVVLDPAAGPTDPLVPYASNAVPVSLVP
jgi:hypothetical protein